MRPARGFRARLVVALVATSAATLVAAILTLVPPLDHRLQQDRLTEMRTLARTARFGLVALPGHRLRQGSPSVRRLVVDLQRRMGGRVALYAADGESLADTDPDRRVPGTAELERREDARLARRGDVREGVRDGEAIVVAGVRRASGDRLTLVLRKPLGDTRAAGNVVRAALPTAAAVGAGGRAAARPARSAAGCCAACGACATTPVRSGDEGLGHTVEVGPPDEVGEVAGALEAMRARLVEEEAARQAFLATASHELRTPLATLQGTLELLQEGLGGGGGAERPPPGRGPARRCTRPTGWSALATDLLDLNRIDGEGPLTAEPVELRELAGVLRGGGRRRPRGGRPRSEDQRRGAGARVRRPGGRAARPAPAARQRPRLWARDGHGGRSNAPTAPPSCASATRAPGSPARTASASSAASSAGPSAGAHPGFGLGLPLARGLAERMGGTPGRAARRAGGELRAAAAGLVRGAGGPARGRFGSARPHGPRRRRCGSTRSGPGRCGSGSGCSGASAARCGGRRCSAARGPSRCRSWPGPSSIPRASSSSTRGSARGRTTPRSRASRSPRRRRSARGLRAAGIEPADVRTVVLTHLHGDHMNGLSTFPGARVLVSDAEARASATPLARAVRRATRQPLPAGFDPSG